MRKEHKLHIPRGSADFRKEESRQSRFALENFHPLRFQWQTKKDSSWHKRGAQIQIGNSSHGFAMRERAREKTCVCSGASVPSSRSCLCAIIRLHPTTEGVEIPMGGRQKCGNPKKKVELLMRPIPPVVHPACNTPLQYTIAYVVFL